MTLQSRFDTPNAREPRADSSVPPSLTSPSLSAIGGVRHAFFGRRGGVSAGRYASLNCGYGSNDDRALVHRNRHRTATSVGLAAADVLTVHQVHGNDVHVADAASPGTWDFAKPPRADAIVTAAPGIAIGILTADCVPILFAGQLADTGDPIVGAAHAGWKGALAGIAEAAIESMLRRGAAPDSLRAAVGPSIAQSSYEVDEAFVTRFTDADATNSRFFVQGRPGHHHFDLPGYVITRLQAAGIGSVGDLAVDTLANPDDYYSYRRGTLEGIADYGRQIAVIGIGR
ncbi:peptidoglycan editing factor PgeF [Fodinicurvata sp. EGI_FJ10296]|uniref:peptidoglycan editing factor PgeF n=1 Tax=Fodinicurvata sp. EGI_FJ10296 TaxID=3231908 RepID=UPI0034553FAA